MILDFVMFLISIYLFYIYKQNVTRDFYIWF